MVESIYRVYHCLTILQTKLANRTLDDMSVVVKGKFRSRPLGVMFKKVYSQMPAPSSPAAMTDVDRAVPPAALEKAFMMAKRERRAEKSGAE